VSGKTKGACFATFIERKTRLYTAVKMPDRTKESMELAIKQVYNSLPNKAFITATTDRGGEFACFKKIETDLKVKLYFADPYCSHQRGSNSDRKIPAAHAFLCCFRVSENHENMAMGCFGSFIQKVIILVMLATRNLLTFYLSSTTDPVNASVGFRLLRRFPSNCRTLVGNVALNYRIRSYKFGYGVVLAPIYQFRHNMIQAKLT